MSSAFILPVAFLALTSIGLVGWNIGLSVTLANQPAAGGGGVLAPQITSVSFSAAPNYVVQIGIANSLTIQSVNAYQYVGVARNGVIVSSSTNTPPGTLPAFSTSLVTVSMPSNFTFEHGDVIYHRYYSASTVGSGVVIASTESIYNRICLADIRNVSIPFCWNTNNQSYCTTPQVGITGQILTDVGAYMAANVSSLLALDKRTGCYAQLDGELYTEPIKVTSVGKENCMKFLMNIPLASLYNENVFVLPAFRCLGPDCTSTFATSGDVNLFINFQNIRNATDHYVSFDTTSNVPPWAFYFTQSPQDTPLDINVTICGYMSSWSFHLGGYVVWNQRRQNGITTVYQWGDLGLTHLDWNYQPSPVGGGTNSLFTTVTATDQPSFSTLTSIMNFEYLKGTQITSTLPNAIATWNMSKIIYFDYAFSSVQLTSDYNGLSNWVLNNREPVSMYSMFYGSSKTGSVDINVTNWNPLVGNLDYAFAFQTVVVPNILTWTLQPYLCANYMLQNINSAVLSVSLYDALLNKFAAETTSTNCQWTGIPVAKTIASLAARVTLCCNRTWTITDSDGNACTGIC